MKRILIVLAMLPLLLSGQVLTDVITHANGEVVNHEYHFKSIHFNYSGLAIKNNLIKIRTAPTVDTLETRDVVFTVSDSDSLLYNGTWYQVGEQKDLLLTPEPAGAQTISDYARIGYLNIALIYRFRHLY